MTASSEPFVLRVNSISKRFGLIAAISEISLDLKRGEVVAIIGSSGSGKSTLLRCIDLIEWIDQGSIVYGSGVQVSVSKDGRPLIHNGPSGSVLTMRSASEIRRRLGFVFQGYDLWEEKTVLENLVLAPRVVNGEGRLSAEATAMGLCERFGLVSKIRARAWQLSGGQRQRIAIIRALMMRPELLLLDEITSSLDPILTYEVMQLIRELKNDGMTMLLVTHHWQFARGLADRVIFLHNGQIVQQGPPKILIEAPASPEVRSYLSVLEAIA